MQWWRDNQCNLRHLSVIIMASLIGLNCGPKHWHKMSSSTYFAPFYREKKAHLKPYTVQHCCNSGETSAINYKTWKTKVKQKEKNKAVKQKKKRRWGNIKRRNEGETAEIWVFLQQEGETLQREGKAVCSALTHIAQWSAGAFSEGGTETGFYSERIPS